MNAWLPSFRSDARHHLICFPYAGGGANIFRLWRTQFPADIEVCPVRLPGRETRFREKPFEQLDLLVAAMLPDFQQIPGPFSFYGHSMGAWIAYALCRALYLKGAPLPQNLFVAARRAPHLPDRAQPLHALPEAALIAQLQARYGAIPAAVLAEPELLRMFLPMLRADFSLIETWQAPPPLPLPLALWALHGKADPGVMEAEMQAWSGYSAGRFSFQAFEGEHFFLNGPNPALMQFLKTKL